MPALALCGVLFASTAEAANGTWTNLTGGSWTNAANWADGVIAAGPESLADFSSLVLASSPVVTLDGDKLIGGLALDDTFYSGTNSWVFNGSSADVFSGGTLTLATSSGTPIVTVNMPNTGPSARINASVAGTAGLDKQGSGLLILGNSTNPLSGTVSVSAGVLSTLNASFSLPGISGITVASGAQFMLGVLSGNGGVFTNGNAITLAGGGAPVGGAYMLGSDLVIRGNSTTNYLTNTISLTGPATIGVSGIGTVCRLKGGVSGTGPLTLWLGNGAGTGATQPDTLELESPLSHDGDTIFSYTISTAIVRLNNHNLLPTGSSLILQGVASGNGSQTFALNGFNQALAGVGCVSTVGSATQHKVVGGSSTLSTLTINDDTDRTFNGLLGGTLANENNLRIIKQGAGTWTLGGTAPTFTGGLWVQGGKVILTSGNFAPAGGWITIDPAAVLQTTQPAQANPTAGVTNNGAWIVNRTGGQAISVPITGSGHLTNIGTAVLTLSATNTYTGRTVATAGGLSLSTSKCRGGGDVILDDSLGAALSLTVTNDLAGTILTNANLTIGTSGGTTTTLTFGLGFGNPSGPLIRVPGTFSASGTVNVVLSGTSLGVGQFTLVKYGKLAGSGFAAFNPTVTTPPSVAATLVNNTANNSIDLQLIATGVEVWNGSVSGDWDSSTLNWTNRSVASGLTNYSGTRVVLFDDGAAGVTEVNLTTAVTPPLTTVSNVTKDYSFSSSSGGYLSGTGPLIKKGAGRLTVSTADDYSGGTQIQAGSLVLGASEVLPDGPGKGGLTLAGLLDLNGFTETVSGLSGAGVATNSATGIASLTVNGNGTFSGSVLGAVDFTIAAGSQALAGSNSYSGLTKITGGTLILANPSGQCLPGDLLMDGSILPGVLNAISPNQFSPTAILTMSADFNGELFTLNANQTIGGLVSTGAGGNRVVAGQGVLTLNPPAGQTNDFEGLVYVRNGDGPLGLVKMGDGTQIIGTRNTPNGANALSFSGGLLVSGGTMWLRYSAANFSVITNNAALVLDLPYDVDRTTAIKGTGAITKLGGGVLWLQSSADCSQLKVLEGTLGGEGSIAAPVTVVSGATLSPGHGSVGQLTIAGMLTLDAGSETIIEMDRAFGTQDRVTGMTTVNFGGTLTVNKLGGAFIAGDTYQLFSAVTYGGNFSATNLPALDGNLRWAWNPAAGTLAVVSYSTTPTNIVAVLSGNTLELTWPEDHTGWLLQAQTNSLSVGIGTNWSVWPGSATTNHVSVPVDAANGSVFFRLLMP